MSAGEPQIVAIGGGGLSADPDRYAIERYIVGQARRARPSVCYVGTASGDENAYAVRFYAAMAELDCRASRLPFFARTPDLRQLVLAQDVVYVGGGNTKSMLAVWREWGLDAMLREAWGNGTLLCGTSAGAICWFDSGVTDSWADALQPMPCLGFLPGACCPHYDGEKERRPAVQRLVADGRLASVLALDDGAAAHFRGTALAGIVTSRPKALGYRVEKSGSTAREDPLPARYLGAPQD
jgi:dipeptidase E